MLEKCRILEHRRYHGRTWCIRSVVFFGFRAVFVAPALLTRRRDGVASDVAPKFADVIVNKHVTVDEKDVRKV